MASGTPWGARVIGQGFVCRAWILSRNAEWREGAASKYVYQRDGRCFAPSKGCQLPVVFVHPVSLERLFCSLGLVFLGTVCVDCCLLFVADSVFLGTEHASPLTIRCVASCVVV